jgi:hypothetical protein
MGLDIHGVLGEAVAEPAEKKQERAKWAPLMIMMLPITSRTACILDDFYQGCSCTEMADQHLDSNDAKIIESLCMPGNVKHWGNRNTKNRNPSLRQLKFLLRETNK